MSWSFSSLFFCEGNMILKGYLFSFLYGALCLLLGTIIHKIGVSQKITRKIVHILVGFEWIILYNFVGATYHFLVVCIAFLLLLIFVYKKNLMPMMQSDGDNAPGTVYYALAMSIVALIMLFIPEMILPFGIGVFCTSFGDGFAGLVGQTLPGRINPKIFGKKTLAGTLSNLAVSFAVAFVFSSLFSMGLGVLGCVVIALFALELELFSVNGLDNVVITLGTSGLAYSLCTFSETWNYIVPVLLTPLLVVFVLKKKALTISGTIAALILDVAISVSLKNAGFLILLSFLIFGLLTDKIKKTANKSRQSEKRGAIQVLCNGGISAVFALAFLVSGERCFLIGFCASLAEALSDTAASGIGSMSKRTYDIFRFKKCENGISGGVSLLGTLASLGGSALISAISLALGLIDFGGAVLVFAVGFVGCFFDSFLGSLVQVKFRCDICGKITEKKIHCGAGTRYFSGIKAVDNSVVNFLGTLASGILAAFLYTV